MRPLAIARHEAVPRRRHTRRLVALDEGALQRIERAVAGQPFDGGDPGAVRGHGQLQAAVVRLAVDEHRAGAALAMVAALSAGELPPLAQQVEQRDIRRDRQRLRGTVDLGRDRNGARIDAAGGTVGLSIHAPA